MSWTDETQFTDKWGIRFLHCVNNRTVHELSNLLAYYVNVTSKQSLMFSKSKVPPHSESSNLCGLFDPADWDTILPQTFSKYLRDNLA